MELKVIKWVENCGICQFRLRIGLGEWGSCWITMGKTLSRVNCLTSRNGGSRGNELHRKHANKAKKTGDLIYVEYPDRVFEKSTSLKEDRESFVKHDSLILQATEEPNGDPGRLDTIPEGDEHSTKTTNASDNKLVPRMALLAPDTSKRIGNSIELVTCPEISTITHLTERRGHGQGEEFSKQLTPNQIQEDDLTAVTPLYYSEYGDVSAIEMSQSTLIAPPNSVNSQFISGIAPMDSIHDVEFKANATADSVFAHDLSFVPEHRLDAVYCANFGAGRLLLNNNSLVACPDSTIKSDARIINRNSFELSGGPGLDSDFGASAGVEMRIVSSDFSGAAENNASRISRYGRTLAIPRETDYRTVVSDQQPYRRRGSSNFTPSTLPIMEMVPTMNSDGGVSYTMLVRNRRPATIGAPEDLFQNTMEWDPYGIDYGHSRWKEFFIPGVTLPPQPVLCPEEYWF